MEKLGIVFKNLRDVQPKEYEIVWVLPRGQELPELGYRLDSDKIGVWRKPNGEGFYGSNWAFVKYPVEFKVSDD